MLTLMKFVFLSLILHVYFFNNKTVVDGTHDDTTSRPNTLFDNADDIQRQLDNEARDKFKYGHTKTIWVFHFPHQFPGYTPSSENSRRPRNLSHHLFLRKTKENVKTALDDWHYRDQETWPKKFPECNDRSQSPIDLPSRALVPVKNNRKLMFCNYNTIPEKLELTKDGKRVIMYGVWKDKERPFIHGGPVYSRKYIFHSLTVHFPSEHLVGGIHYPVETQALHVSADYENFEAAVKASRKDPQAFLNIGSLYQFSNISQEGFGLLADILNNLKGQVNTESVMEQPLQYFVPSFKEYVIYQGSLTTPPCSQSVVWIIRGRTLSVNRNVAKEVFKGIMSKKGKSEYFIRNPQPLNDRKVFYVH